MNIRFRQIILDLDEFIQREGSELDRDILRNKLQFLLKNIKVGKPMTIIRGLLIRLTKLETALIILKTVDIIQFFVKSKSIMKIQRKLTLERIIKPMDLIKLTGVRYPLKLEYK